jgi:EVE domain-containing protein
VTTDGPRFWIGVASREHVLRGVGDGVAQLGRGKRGPLARMRAGDWIAYYSPRTQLDEGEPCQAFTALGQLLPGPITQADLGDGFHPYRRAVDYLPVQDAPIRPIVPELSFIRDKARWGSAFRFGHLEVPRSDFARIAHALGVDPVVLDRKV